MPGESLPDDMKQYREWEDDLYGLLRSPGFAILKEVCSKQVALYRTDLERPLTGPEAVYVHEYLKGAIHGIAAMLATPEYIVRLVKDARADSGDDEDVD